METRQERSNVTPTKGYCFRSLSSVGRMVVCESPKAYAVRLCGRTGRPSARWRQPHTEIHSSLESEHTEGSTPSASPTEVRSLGVVRTIIADFQSADAGSNPAGSIMPPSDPGEEEGNAEPISGESLVPVHGCVAQAGQSRRLQTVLTGVQILPYPLP